MADPLAPPEPVVIPPSPEPVRRPGKVRCEFCECELSPVSGEFQQLSDKAKTFRKHADTIEQLRADLVAKTTEHETAVRERDEARAAVLPANRPSWWLRDTID